LVIVTKYRRKVFTKWYITKTLKEKVLEISSWYGVEIIAQETDQDHIHILFKCSPKLIMTKYINVLKGVTSRTLRTRFPEIKRIIWKNCLWSPSYCLLTTGEVKIWQVKKYVENQGKNNGTRSHKK